ncbi:MAG: asparagine synthetase B, partial [Nonlabens sp.]|nr:asparagine synthetase B [Nonlabens sp.]
MTFKKIALLTIILLTGVIASAQYILVPMDAETQKDHLKAYGVSYWVLTKGTKVKWLLNYRGGSFLMPNVAEIKKELIVRGVSFEELGDGAVNDILSLIASPSQNMQEVLLEKAPKIAVYTPTGKLPWDDAVTMVLEYAEIPYDKVYDEEVLEDKLLLYDWLHLHHEDFTGQYGKFYGSFRAAQWYIQEKREAEELAAKLGYSKVSEAKRDVALKIRDYVIGGGFMFAMCSATDSFDIALAAEGVDICEPMFDGDASDAGYQNQIDYAKTFAFTDFQLERSPTTYEFSTIDMTNKRKVSKELDYFSLMDFSAKWDPIPTMLNQNHTSLVKGFMGQTTSYDPDEVKKNVLVLGENRANGEAKYIHGIRGKGFFTFYGGHDPEDYQHRVGD